MNLDDETRARIRAEEEERVRVREELAARKSPLPTGWSPLQIILLVIAVLIILGLIAQWAGVK